MTHTSRGIWHPSLSESVKPTSRDFKDLAITANNAIDEVEWSKTDTILTSVTNLATLEKGIHQVGSGSIARNLGLPIEEISALTVVELGNFAVLEQWGFAGDQRIERYQAWRDSSGNIGLWRDVALGHEIIVESSTTDLDNLNQQKRYTLRNSANIVNAPRTGVNAFLRVEWTTGSGLGVIQTWEDAQTDYAIFRRRSINRGDTWTDWVQINAGGSSKWTATDSVYFWGDSAVSGLGGGNTGDSLQDQLGQHINTTVVPRGEGGRTSNQALLRAGAIVVHAIPVGGTIPESGAVDLDLQGQIVGGWDPASWTGFYAGIYGTLRNTATGMTFTRSASGSAVTVNQPEPFLVSDRIDGTGTHIFLMGGNDWLTTNPHEPEPDKATHVIANYLRSIEAVPSPTRHVIIGGVKTRRDTEIGDANHEFVQHVNSELARLVPQHFVSRQDWLVHNALDALGLTPTQEDLDHIAAGIIPKRAFDDVTHVDYRVVAVEAQDLWATTLAQRGWA